MSKPKAHLSMASDGIYFHPTPTRVKGTKFWLIGTTKPDATILWLNTLGECSDLSVPTGTRIFMRRKDTKEAFNGNPTIKEIVTDLRENPPADEDDYVFLNVTLEASLPELFRSHRGRHHDREQRPAQATLQA